MFNSTPNKNVRFSKSATWLLAVLLIGRYKLRTGLILVHRTGLGVLAAWGSCELLPVLEACAASTGPAGGRCAGLSVLKA